MLLLLAFTRVFGAGWDYPATNAAWGPVHAGGDVGPSSAYYEGGYDCSTGKLQSPIDVPAAALSSGTRPATQFTYTTQGLTVESITNNGHTIDMKFEVPTVATDYITINKDGNPRKFVPVGAHFHAGSENFLAGKQQGVEVHFVHADVTYPGCAFPACLGPNLAVMGMFFQRGDEGNGGQTICANGQAACRNGRAHRRNGDADANSLFEILSKGPRYPVGKTTGPVQFTTTAGVSSRNRRDQHGEPTAYNCDELSLSTNCRWAGLNKKFARTRADTLRSRIDPGFNGNPGINRGGANSNLGVGAAGAAQTAKSPFRFANFIGSLTTPPCAQGVNWFLDLSAPAMNTAGGCGGKCGYVVRYDLYDAVLSRFFQTGLGKQSFRYPPARQWTAAYAGYSYLRNVPVTPWGSNTNAVQSRPGAAGTGGGVVVTKSMGNFRAPQGDAFFAVAAEFRGIRNMGTDNTADPVNAAAPILYHTSGSGSSASNAVANACATGGITDSGCTPYNRATYAAIPHVGAAAALAFDVQVAGLNKRPYTAQSPAATTTTIGAFASLIIAYLL